MRSGDFEVSAISDGVLAAAMAGTAVAAVVRTTAR